MSQQRRCQCIFQNVQVDQAPHSRRSSLKGLFGTSLGARQRVERQNDQLSCAFRQSSRACL